MRKVNILKFAAMALGLALAACSVTNGLVGNGWTGTAAADVEVNVALGAVSYLKGFEAQVPNAAPAVKAAGAALAAGVLAAANAMTSGASPAVQGKQAAINAVLAVAPSLGTLITSKQTGSGGAITVAVDLGTLLLDEVNYVGPSYAAANAGTITATQLSADEAALQSAAGAL